MTIFSTFGPTAVHRKRLAFALPAAALLLPSAAFAKAVQGPIGTIVVPRNITYWEMFSNATAVVKLVMLLLVGASLVSWAVWFSKLSEVRDGRRRLIGDIALLAKAEALDKAGAVEHGATIAMLESGCAELKRAGALSSVAAAEGVKERSAARLLAVENRSVEKMMRGVVVLATIGAIAPFVGLFGTVWGIMNSFIGISQSNTTNLAVVAPGIAEALLATAMGLVAAIPSVVMYNHIARAIAGFRRLLGEASTQVACLLSQDVDALVAKQLPASAVRAA